MTDIPEEATDEQVQRLVDACPQAAPIADTVVMDENAIEAVIDLLWREFDRYLPDGAIHPHAMRAIAARIVKLLNDGDEHGN